jgi:hypothetical protein
MAAAIAMAYRAAVDKRSTRDVQRRTCSNVRGGPVERDLEFNQSPFRETS